MKCISDELIQKFTDGETNPKENAVIRSHLAHCNSCTKKVELRKELSAGVKRAVNLLAKEGAPSLAPVFEKETPIKKAVSTRKIFYGIAAACAIIAILVFVPFGNNSVKQGSLIFENVQRDYDANKTFTQQEMVIQITDPQGTVNEFIIE